MNPVANQRFTFLLFIVLSKVAMAGDVEVLRMKPAMGMTRAELYYVKIANNPKAVLVLCPGANGSGEGLVRSEAWVDFARRNQLGLIGLSFASTETAIHDGTGYYYASKGAGGKLLEGVRKIYHKDIPILIYGFSGGAHFTSRFEEWKPQWVIAWCAYSAEWWDKPVKSDFAPPGIVACGDKDERYGASLVYFKQGRAIGKPWIWVTLPNIGHEGAPKLDDFVRSYFSTILDNKMKKAEIVDIDLKTVIQASEAQAHPSLSGWLPSDELFNLWRSIHEP